MNVEIQLTEAFPVHLSERRWGIGTRSGHVRKVTNGSGVDAGPRGKWVVAEIAVVQTATPATQMIQVQGKFAGRDRCIRDVGPEVPGAVVEGMGETRMV